MKVAIAADHAGSLLLTPVLDEVRRLGHEALDLGTHDAVTPDDYPDRAADLAAALADGRADRGILVCGSGVGASVAANKVRGIRAALCHDTYSAHQGVEHDEMNVLCLGARVIGEALAQELVRAFLSARFSGEPRHRRRVEKIAAMESKFCGIETPRR
ncbi:MAG: RpiB/LacA/LacB family sugar-phosphate isomerase [Candidatus Korobacteraceae bacterium]|jgi:ribose 5-phosphate isomerase B